MITIILARFSLSSEALGQGGEGGGVLYELLGEDVSLRPSTLTPHKNLVQPYFAILNHTKLVLNYVLKQYLCIYKLADEILVLSFIKLPISEEIS